MSQAGCDEFAGTAGPEATAETSKRDRDMPGRENRWYISNVNRHLCHPADKARTVCSVL